MSVELERGKVYTVDRGESKVHAGQGLLAGLAVIQRHVVDAFTKKLDKPSQTSGIFTVQYPEERLPLAQAFRNFPILLYEDTSGQMLCTGCFQCERICPPQVIHITQATDPATNKPVPASAEFLIEYDACMSCGLCAEVCPFDSIKMDHNFELATDDHPGLNVGIADLARPISYYESLAPAFWEEARDSALKKLQGNVKRRPGAIGIAPQLVGKVPENPPSAPAPAPAKPAPVAAAPAPAAEAAPLDKAARLAAIRAKNAARANGEAPAAEAAPVAPVDEKAARLAAIRAKNAAKAAAEAAAAAPVEAAPAAPVDEKAARLAAIRAKNAAKAAAEAAAAAPVETAPAAPVDEKAARLAAIRAKNAAKKAQEEAAAPAAEAAPAAPAAPTDEKAARLAAIRAANAAKKAQQTEAGVEDEHLVDKQ